MEELTIKEGAKGDIKAFKKIFDYYLPKMRPIAARYAYTVFETDDILQESFVKVFHNLRHFQFKGSFEGWIKRIVVNTAINHYKNNRTLYLSDHIEEVDEEMLGSEEMLEEAEPSQLLAILQELPEGYKMVFNLYVFEDYSHKEIADMLSISEGTSRSQYSKARKMLLKLLLRQRNKDFSTLITKEGKDELR